MIILITAGCISENEMKIFKKSTPNALNCSGTWYYIDNQTCCGHTVHTKQVGFVCSGEEYFMPRNLSLEVILSQLNSSDSLNTIPATIPVTIKTHDPLGPPSTVTPEPMYTNVQAIPTVAPTGVPAVAVTYEAVPVKYDPVTVKYDPVTVKYDPVTVKYDPPTYKEDTAAPVKAVPAKK